MADISGVVDGGSTLPSGIAQPDLPPAEAWGEQPRLATREIPLTERRWSSTLPSPRRPAQLIRATKWFRVVKFQPGANTGLGFGHSRISMEVNLLIFEAAPQPLDEDVVHTPALAVHPDHDPVPVQGTGQVV